MAGNSIFGVFLLQAFCVALVSWTLRRGIPARLNILLSCAFVTVPLWTYRPLADVGMVFLFDIVVAAFLVSELLLQKFVIPAKSVALIGGLLVLLPVLFAPISYFFLDPSYIAYHTLLLSLVLVRSLLIFVAVVVLVRGLRFADHNAVARLMAFQCLVLFALGAVQYLAGVDFVVFERLKDVENIIDLRLSGDQKVFFGLGFLGLFRGAIPLMALIGVFWWLVVNTLVQKGQGERYLLIAMFLLGIISIAGCMSRIGVIAIVCVLLYSAYVNRHLRLWTSIALVAGIPFLLYSSFLQSLQGPAVDLIVNRFTVDQFTGESGSGGTRIDSVVQLIEAAQSGWQPWIVGLGGFNPIATNEYYGLFGMHGDYLDVLARYGIVVGLVYAGFMAVVFGRQLEGFYSRNPVRNQVPRAFGALGIGLLILALTQGVVLISGTAGYLASAQTWLAVAFCVGVRKYRGAAAPQRNNLVE